MKLIKLTDYWQQQHKKTKEKTCREISLEPKLLVKATRGKKKTCMAFRRIKTIIHFHMLRRRWTKCVANLSFVALWRFSNIVNLLHSYNFLHVVSSINKSNYCIFYKQYKSSEWMRLQAVNCTQYVLVYDHVVFKFFLNIC